MPQTPCNPCSQNYPGFGGGWWSWGWNQPKSSNMPPSPEPPWGRQVQNPLAQVIVQNDTIDLTKAVTFLSQSLNDPPAPVSVNIPNGTAPNQTKQILIAGDKIPTTETFVVMGVFAGGFGKLQFDTIGFSALLFWDGASWQVMGGNATLQ